MSLSSGLKDALETAFGCRGRVSLLREAKDQIATSPFAEAERSRFPWRSKRTLQTAAPVFCKGGSDMAREAKSAIAISPSLRLTAISFPSGLMSALVVYW